MNPVDESEISPSPEKVILIHGLAGSRWDMWPLARKLRKGGFQVWNWSYRSLGLSIGEHADRLRQDLAEATSDHPALWNVVTHSMGGIILRAAMTTDGSLRFGRVVMLAPPHRGSHAARSLTPYLGWMTPSLGELSDATDSFVNQLPNPFPVQTERFGIVEVRRDRVIAEGTTQLDGCSDFIQVPGQHGIFPWYPKTMKLVEVFLREGGFVSANKEQIEETTHTVAT